MMGVKKAFTKHKRNHATFMYIPESESKVVSVRIPTWLPKVTVFSLALLIIGTFTAIYMAATINQQYSESKVEISSLVEINNSQKLEIEKLQNEAIQIQQQLQENIDALDQIKEMVGIKKSSEGTDVTQQESENKNTSSSSLQQSSKDAVEQLDEIKTSYKELSTQLMTQHQIIEESAEAVKKQVAYLNAIPSIKPVNAKISDTFGYRKNPFTSRGSEFHSGIDFAGSVGTPVMATGDGVVIFAGWQSGYGNVVIISHGYGITTLYGHNSKLLVKKGEKVKKGQVISKMGSTGRSTGPHLHYEVRVDGKAVNPSMYINK
jgi:murein DD-endopeptidase MepM/ murein hydrolase activator NlpD